MSKNIQQKTNKDKRIVRYFSTRRILDFSEQAVLLELLLLSDDLGAVTGVSQAAMAKNIGSNRTAVNKVIKRLESKKMIKISKDEMFKNQYLIQLN